VHGDLRRANIAYMGDGRVCLLDWERAMRGHAAIDLAWYWFLQFWAYPPEGPFDPSAHLRAYLVYLEEARGSSVDRAAFNRAWGFAWLKVLSELGWLLAEPLMDERPSADAAERVRVNGTRAFAQAREAMENV
jgi:aminoglycoside phosphotransferase (APT) family kinase protein